MFLERLIKSESSRKFPIELCENEGDGSIEQVKALNDGPPYEKATSCRFLPLSA